METSVRCAGCGYSLAGIAATDGCPECGLGAEAARRGSAVAGAPTSSLTILLVGVMLGMPVFAIESLSRFKFFALESYKVVLGESSPDVDFVRAAVGFLSTAGARVAFGSTLFGLLALANLWLLGESLGATSKSRRVWTRRRWLVVVSFLTFTAHWWLNRWEAVSSSLETIVFGVMQVQYAFYWWQQACGVGVLWAAFMRVSGRRWSVAVVCLLTSVVLSWALQLVWDMTPKEPRLWLDLGLQLTTSGSSLWIAWNILRVLWPEWKKRRQAELKDEA